MFLGTHLRTAEDNMIQKWELYVENTKKISRRRVVQMLVWKKICGKPFDWKKVEMLLILFVWVVVFEFPSDAFG